MKKVLYVEDDALIARLYSQKLQEAGFDVAVAEDGLAAMKLLVEFKPDLMVLDLLMPKMTGADVLKFIRQRPELQSVRVVVFSNSFLSGLAEQVAAAKVERALVKASVTPVGLIDIVRDVLEEPVVEKVSLVTPPLQTKTDKANQAESPAPPGTEQDRPARKIESEAEFRARVRRDFFDKIPSINQSVRQLCREFIESSDSASQPRRLEELTRKVGFLTEMTGLAGCHHISHLAGACEALLLDIQGKPSLLNDSVRNTITTALAFLTDQLDSIDQPEQQMPPPASVLVVDDDAVSNRAVVMTLNKLRHKATGVTDPFDALKSLERSSYDLVLLDIDMPGMDGLTLCEKMRGLPAHKRTPVIFVTGLTDFKTRARSVLSGGNELITKPILPLELTVKSIMMSLQHRQRNSARP